MEVSEVHVVDLIVEDVEVLLLVVEANSVAVVALLVAAVHAALLAAGVVLPEEVVAEKELEAPRSSSRRTDTRVSSLRAARTICW